MRIAKFLVTGAALLMTAPTLAAGPPESSTPADSPTSTSPAVSPSAGSPAASSSASGNVTVGATVKDPNGGVVGTIESLDGQYAVLATQKNKVRLPLSSFGKG